MQTINSSHSVLQYLNYRTIESTFSQFSARILEQYVLWGGAGAMGKAFELAINRSRVQILLEVMLRNNLGQVVYTYVPLSLSSIIWYRPNGGDALRLGR